MVEDLTDCQVKLETIPLSQAHVPLAQQVIQLPVCLVVIDDAFPAEVHNPISGRCE